MSSGWVSFKNRFGKKQQDNVLSAMPEKDPAVEAAALDETLLAALIEEARQIQASRR